MTDKSNPIQDLHGEFAQKEKPKQTLEVSHTKWWDVRCLVSEENISGEIGNEQARIAAERGMCEAAVLLQAGDTVAFPTETVYGLGADARSTAAVEAVFAAKGRPSDNPLIVHISDPVQLNGMVAQINDTARALMDAFWPGPLTLVLPVVPQALSPRVTAGLDTVGVRMPDHPIALR
ncbi:L-threonylcarbamoyladenylate synthase, partial [Paenibacillus sp. 1-18]